ncbi:hypothetical protein mRhiFer1_008581 [Rhinolophus ferrumequinum]|uniref:Uncharacterized protein n=1 Tax=Rhinolophus ferrumequinum TaxID=59479 RepID=A0A7J7UJW9_RHIFE|nr:hypothetical protein mRhiFer1_008581 [Rhinolophus ferrumequinum]
MCVTKDRDIFKFTSKSNTVRAEPRSPRLSFQARQPAHGAALRGAPGHPQTPHAGSCQEEPAPPPERPRKSCRRLLTWRREGSELPGKGGSGSSSAGCNPATGGRGPNRSRLEGRGRGLEAGEAGEAREAEGVGEAPTRR